MLKYIKINKNIQLYLKISFHFMKNIYVIDFQFSDKRLIDGKYFICHCASIIPRLKGL